MNEAWKLVKIFGLSCVLGFTVLFAGKVMGYIKKELEEEL